MYYSKKNQEPLSKEQIEVWECESEDCIGWMRKDFSCEDHSHCPLCRSRKMRSGERLLVIVPPNPHRR
jgi:hypothetical protein